MFDAPLPEDLSNGKTLRNANTNDVDALLDLLMTEHVSILPHLEVLPLAKFILEAKPCMIKEYHIGGDMQKFGTILYGFIQRLLGQNVKFDLHVALGVFKALHDCGDKRKL